MPNELYFALNLYQGIALAMPNEMNQYARARL